MSLICVSLIDDTISDLTVSAEKCKSLGADIIEIRLDFLRDPLSSTILKESFELKKEIGLPVILTIRPKWEGGNFTGDEEQRLAILEEGIDLGFDYIDIELNMEESKRNSLISLAKKDKVKIIVSYHDYESTPTHDELLSLLKCCIDYGGDIAKVVVTNNEFKDALNVIKAGKAAYQNDMRFILMGMGEYGHITRFVGPIMGCEIVFASLDKDKQVTMGQVDINTLRTKMNFHKLNPETEICGIIGKPLGHTLSPVMYNAAFLELGLNYIYIPMEIPENRLEVVIDGMKDLGFRGMSVTHPYKSKVMRYLDKIDEFAQEIGAVNTIVNEDGILTGYNTDTPGALDAIKESGVDINKKDGKILILGAGGAARAVAVPLAKIGSEIIIANRTYENGKRLADELNKISRTEAIHMDEIENVISDTEILINCTPVGMKGGPDGSPIPIQLIRNDLIVFDMVNSPKNTPLLMAAKKTGARIIYGYEMVIHQGIKAFELWTGVNAPVGVMRNTVLQEMEVG